MKLSPSLLAADFADLKNEVARVERAGVEMLHLDVMDGNFVPNISFGAPVIAALRPHSKLFFDVHLMIERPERYLDDFKNVSEHGECVWLLKEVKREIERVKFESNVKLNIRQLVNAIIVAFIKEHNEDLKNIDSG